MTAITAKEQAVITKYDLLFESRLTRVETTLDNVDSHIKELKTDMRWMLGLMKWMLGLILTTTGGTLALMAHGFHWIP